MVNDTKKRILESALKLFSEKGYEGTNIRELSASLGLSKAAFYKHYKSKEELWNSIIWEMNSYYAEHFGSAEHPPAIPASTDELFRLSMKMIDFTVHDEMIVMTRKIMLAEQFHNEHVRRLATERFNSGLESLFAVIFGGMIENGSVKAYDPEMLAFCFTAPISSLVLLCDREPEKRPDIMLKIEAFIKHFVNIYGAENEK